MAIDIGGLGRKVSAVVEALHRSVTRHPRAGFLCVLALAQLSAQGQDFVPVASDSLTENLMARRYAGTDFELHVSGHLMYDWAEVQDDANLDLLAAPLDATSGLRELLLDTTGRFRRTHFRLKFDLTGDKIELQDSYLLWKDIPYVGSIRLGHAKEPFGLKNGTSLQNVPMMERSLVYGLAPARGVGLSFSNTALSERLAWQLGAFYDTNSVEKLSASKSFSMTGRVTGLPIYEKDESTLLHIGASMSLRSLDAPLRVKVRPESYWVPVYLDTGDLTADNAFLLGAEAAYQRGPLLIQSEWIGGTTDGAILAQDVTLSDVANEISSRYPRLVEFLSERFDYEPPSDSVLWSIPFDISAREEPRYFGAYGMVSYVLTGEAHSYDTSTGLFGGVVPENPVRFRGGHGWGAWEIAARLSHADLNDEQLHGGRQTNLSLGLNWYLNEWVRMSAGYVHGEVERDGSEGDLNLWQMRVQISLPK